MFNLCGAVTFKINFRTNTFNIPTALTLIDFTTPTMPMPYGKDSHLN